MKVPWHSFSGRLADLVRGCFRWNLPVALAQIILLTVSLYGPVYAADTPTTQPPGNDHTQLNPAIVTAQRVKQLQTEIRKYVSSVLVRPWEDSLTRWDTPICPLVAGLPRDQGEYVLALVSKIARESDAPVAGEQCKANLLIIVTWQPDLLLKMWNRRATLFDSNSSTVQTRSFLNSKAPIRVWYNFSFKGGDGTSVSTGADPSLVGGLSSALQYQNLPVLRSNSCRASKLCYGALQTFSSVIVVVDKNQINNVNMGQLVSYVAMVGLADIEMGANTESTPSILSLFKRTETPPQELSTWDRALLYGLYTSSQSNKMQMTQMKSTMLKRLLQ